MLNSFGERALCKLGPLDYTQAEVLNQRIEESLLFSHPGDVVEGMILATGIRPIPQVFGQGMRVPFEMTFEDEFENEIRVDAELCVERETKPKRAGCDVERVCMAQLQGSGRKGSLGRSPETTWVPQLPPYDEGGTTAQRTSRKG